MRQQQHKEGEKKKIEIHTAVLLKIQVLLDVMFCCWASSSQHFKGSATTHRMTQHHNPKD